MSIFCLIDIWDCSFLILRKMLLGFIQCFKINMMSILLSWTVVRPHLNSANFESFKKQPQNLYSYQQHNYTPMSLQLYQHFVIWFSEKLKGQLLLKCCIIMWIAFNIHRSLWCLSYVIKFIGHLHFSLEKSSLIFNLADIS